LKKSFDRLGDEFGFADDYDMQMNLTKNIEFIFGPPGTGKTTHLAKKVIIPLMQDAEGKKVLVLTPTNKAADVLVNRVIGEMGDENSYKDWLVRFGTTDDKAVEESGVFKDKTFDIRSLPKSVTVTTIARFPYDFFMPDNERLYLSALNWDYIIIDEASMIQLVNIVYPLYKKTPKKFIIAGDPFQIEPITSVDMWKDENIYTMVKLGSFTNPSTIPHQYCVELLTTQYRSVPVIGEVFGGFAYGGILKHNRTDESQAPLGISDKIGIKSINIIKFPVSRYESIYRPKALNHKSPYQVYSAIFTFEFTRHLVEWINNAGMKRDCKIGIIAPYRAQADLINSLSRSAGLPENVIQVGTIHGFQGDECDIIISVFNPPQSIGESKNMFLNKKNIINVSISRARDYLFIVMPDDETENVNNLKLIKRVEELCKARDCALMQAAEIERIMWGSETYIEDNSFSTSHQPVNVYGEPERRYEIRSQDDAVDVQIHR
jgi:superfamily I DNA and/or RNA helicase